MCQGTDDRREEMEALLAEKPEGLVTVVDDVHKFRPCGCHPQYVCTYCELKFAMITTPAPMAGKVQYCPRCGQPIWGHG